MQMGWSTDYQQIDAIENFSICMSDRYDRHLGAVGKPFGYSLGHVAGAPEHRLVDDDCPHDNAPVAQASVPSIWGRLDTDSFASWPSLAR